MDSIPAVKDYIIENFLFGDGDSLDDNIPLFENGFIDSTGVLEIVCFIEEKFDVALEDEELIPENFYSLKTIDSFLKQKKGYSN